MTTIKRNLYYVEPSIRPNIVRRILFYWSSCVLFSTLPLIIGTTLAKTDRLFYEHLGVLATQYWPLYLMLFGVLPFAIKDALRVTNRTLGPLVRLRAELRRFRDHGVFHPVHCRQDDFLRDLIEEINEALQTREQELLDSGIMPHSTEVA